MKSSISLFLVITLFGLTGCSQASSKPVIKKESTPSHWKTYANDHMGITFQYPGSWTNHGGESNAVDRTGATIGIKVNFIDSVSHTSLLIDYHLPPNSLELYKYAVAQYESSQGMYEKEKQQTVVAGNKAIESFTSMITDGKGNPLNTPLRIVVVYFLDKQQSGLFELQFKIPLSEEDNAIVLLQQVLSTFEFK